MASTPAERQRARRERIAALRDTLPPVPCECGCGTEIPPITANGKPARFAHGHTSPDNPGRFKPGQESYWKGKPNPAAKATHTGKKLTPEEIERRTATRRERLGGSYSTASGWTHSEESRARMSAAQRARDLSGEGNPFYGRTHTPETRETLSQQRRGSLSPTWKGGTGSLPYGPEFTRWFKRVIHERDGYTCRRCGKTREQMKVIQVHHLDHDKTNNDPENVVTSCGSCNVWASWHRDEQWLP